MRREKERIEAKKRKNKGREKRENKKLRKRKEKRSRGRESEKGEGGAVWLLVSGLIDHCGIGAVSPSEADEP